MSSLRYRKLLTNLPSMAAVVNSFQSPEVQLEVYRLLVNELEEATTDACAGALLSDSPSKGSSLDSSATAGLAHQLIDGESIHSISAEDEED